MEPRVWRGDAVIGSRDHTDGWAADLTPAKEAQRRAQRVGRVNQDEDRPERAVGAVQVELDGPVPAGVQRQERTLDVYAIATGPQNESHNDQHSIVSPG